MVSTASVICTAALLLLASFGSCQAVDPSAAGGILAGIHSLATFGPIDDPQQIQETYEKAVGRLGETGGILLVPTGLSRQLKQIPLQGLIRTPAPPAETTGWKHGPGVTVIESNEDHVLVRVPPLSGIRLSRTVRVEGGDSLPHWGTHPVVTVDSKLVHGSSSYLDWLQEPVEKGLDRRFYVPTIRGIRPGQFLNAHGGPGYGGGVTRACVKSLGYDAEKRMSYFVADTELDHQAGAIVHNKTNTGLLHMLQTSNSDNQTYDVKVIRNQHAHGDTYIYYCDFNYMSNIHSAAGDENGNCFAAFIRTLDNNFRGVVENVDWELDRLTFAAGAQNVKTLGDSRPLINLSPAKAITQGKVWIVPSESSFGAGDAEKYPFEGRAYPNSTVADARTGVSGLRMGGLIRGDEDCPWTEAIVGRYFAVTDEGEQTPKGDLRWYLITSLVQNDDGTKDLEIRRFWWGAKSAGSPTLYNLDNYSWDDHLRPLSYTIAPGTYVCNVSRALPGGLQGGQRTLGIAPYPDQGTSFDFEAGDSIEQAIGPDPFRPQAFRVWMWEDVPGAWPSSVLDFANHGAASRHAAMSIAGGGSTMEDAARRQQGKPAWDNVILINAAAGVGLNCTSDFANAAILFQQPNHDQPIKWYYAHGDGKSPREATLTVSNRTGELNFEGEGIRVNGSVMAAEGLSGEATPARNLRGKNVAVEPGATAVKVRFPRAEADGDYVALVEQSWLTGRAVTKKAPEGFTVAFSTPAPEDATLDWMIVR